MKPRATSTNTDASSQAATAGTLLAWAREQLNQSSDSPRLDAEILLGHVLEANRAALYANPDKRVAARQSALFAELVSARKQGRPVAQLTGEREFWSLNLQVNSNVLVPRPETELLVERALALIAADASLQILDLGTGSGAIAIAIASERPACSVTASDNSPAALEIARRNGERHAPGRIAFLHSDWFAALEGQRFHIIISNPPYVSESETDLTDMELDFEPPEALYSGADGLEDIRKIIAASPAMLAASGWLLLEHGYTQADLIRQLLTTAGFSNIESHTDLAGTPRVTTGQLAAPAGSSL